ncbi:agmatine deiminase [Calidifontibacillus oryziterrae]|uniref:agmatine deiminase n=1 Tax=Calidifontibacillus oryziterrae TaxID=1191699 RepID=UPI0002D54079|nr:agmatine deiminase [Calidifontibacillus oryziterrae]
MANTIHSTPKLDGYRMPGEFEEHAGTWMIWPMRTDTWRLGAKPAQEVFAKVAKAIADFEPVTMCVNSSQYEHVREVLPAHIRVVELSTDDAWMRDIGPTIVKNDQGCVRGIDWGFNAWGGLDGGLYFPWDMDIHVKQKILEMEWIDRYDLRGFILEGGSITVDGEGTLITTEQCLLNKNRNPSLSKQEIETILSNYLNVEKIIWLEHGMVNDETDGHVDEVVFFVKPGVVGMSWTDDENDPQYKVLNDAYKVLKEAHDARGRKLEIHKIHIPKQVTISEEEAYVIDRIRNSYDRSAGKQLATTYVNCYICNGAVIVPAFGDPRDEEAAAKIQELFPDRKIIQINTREIALGGGNIHCITQQLPKA